MGVTRPGPADRGEGPLTVLYLTIHQIAERLSVSEGSIRNEIRAGNLRAYRFRGAYRVAQEDLTEYIASCRVKQAQRATKPPIPAKKMGGSGLRHLDGQRSLAAWRRQGEAADPPSAHMSQSPEPSCDPSTPPAS